MLREIVFFKKKSYFEGFLWLFCETWFWNADLIVIWKSVLDVSLRYSIPITSSPLYGTARGDSVALDLGSRN